jgi:plasmid stability protein
MTRLSIDLPEDVRAKLEARANRSGHSSIEEYIQSLLQEEADEAGEEYEAPPHLTFSSDEELEAILVRRIDEPGELIEATPEFWSNLKRQAQQRRAQGK